MAEKYLHTANPFYHTQPDIGGSVDHARFMVLDYTAYANASGPVFIGANYAVVPIDFGIQKTLNQAVVISGNSLFILDLSTAEFTTIHSFTITSGQYDSGGSYRVVVDHSDNSFWVYRTSTELFGGPSTTFIRKYDASGSLLFNTTAEHYGTALENQRIRDAPNAAALASDGGLLLPLDGVHSGATKERSFVKLGPNGIFDFAGQVEVTPSGSIYIRQCPLTGNIFIQTSSQGIKKYNNSGTLLSVFSGLSGPFSPFEMAANGNIIRPTQGHARRLSEYSGTDGSLVQNLQYSSLRGDTNINSGAMDIEGDKILVSSGLQTSFNEFLCYDLTENVALQYQSLTCSPAKTSSHTFVGKFAGSGRMAVMAAVATTTMKPPCSHVFSTAFLSPTPEDLSWPYYAPKEKSNRISDRIVVHRFVGGWYALICPYFFQAFSSLTKVHSSGTVERIHLSGPDVRQLYSETVANNVGILSLSVDPTDESIYIGVGSFQTSTPAILIKYTSQGVYVGHASSAVLPTSNFSPTTMAVNPNTGIMYLGSSLTTTSSGLASIRSVTPALGSGGLSTGSGGGVRGIVVDPDRDCLYAIKRHASTGASFDQILYKYTLAHVLSYLRRRSDFGFADSGNQGYQAIALHSPSGDLFLGDVGDRGDGLGRVFRVSRWNTDTMVMAWERLVPQSGLSDTITSWGFFELAEGRIAYDLTTDRVVVVADRSIHLLSASTGGIVRSHGDGYDNGGTVGTNDFRGFYENPVFALHSSDAQFVEMQPPFDLGVSSLLGVSALATWDWES